jgi:hypothetical protein
MTRLHVYFGLAAAGLRKRCWDITLGNSFWALARRQLPLILTLAGGGLLLVVLRLLPTWSIGNVARRANALFQQRPWLYWHLGFGALAALIVQVVLPFVRPGWAGRRGFWASRSCYALLTVATLLLLRLPGLAAPQVDPDESAQLTNALTLQQDPRYWRSVDGGTAGPLMAFALLPTRLLGLRLDYGAARLMALGLILGCLFFQFGTLRTFFSEAVSRAVVVPLTICIAFFTDADYMSYNGEHPSLFLLCAGAYGCARLVGGPARGVRGRALAIGLALGLVPFTKLQGVPIGLALAAIGLVCLLVRFRGQRRRQLGAVLALSAGGLAPTALVALYLYQQNLFLHFWTSYIGSNWTYTHLSHTGGMYAKFLNFLQWVPRWLPELFYPYFRGTIVGCLLLLGVVRLRPTYRRLLLAVGVVILAGMISVITPGIGFGHYMLFLLMPVAFLSAALLAMLLEGMGTERLLGRIGQLVVVVGILGWALALGSLRARGGGNPHLVFGPDVEKDTDPVVEVIRQYATPGERMAVWGWMDRYYVLAGMRQSTAHCNTTWEIRAASQGPPNDYFYRMYLQQLSQAKPPVFVDAVGLGMFVHDDANQERHDCFPELRQLIAARYELVAALYQTRVYVSKERLAQRGLNDVALRDVPFPVVPSALHGVNWVEGTATCGGPESPYLGFSLQSPGFVRAIRLSFAYPSADRPCEFKVCWREQGRNDFSDGERCFRATLPPSGISQPLAIPVDDTITDFRIYPDDQPRPEGGYACVFNLHQLTLLVRPADQQRLVQEYAQAEVPLSVVPSELRGVQWQEGTATCGGGDPPYLQFSLKHADWVSGVRLTFAYPAADGPSKCNVFWREEGRNEFSGEERCCRLELPAGPRWQSVTIPVRDTISDLRIEPDDTQRPGGYACVFKLGQLSLLVRPADGQRLLEEYAEPDVPLPLVVSESHGVKWEKGIATCAYPILDQPPYLQFSLKHPAFVRGVRLRYAYPDAAEASQFSLFWRERGRNDFMEEHCCRLTLPPGEMARTMIIPMYDTITDLRIYPDDTKRPGGYACVFRPDQLSLLVRPADRERILEEQGDTEGEEQEYAQLVVRVRARVREVVPPTATVLIASEGDNDLIRLEGRTGRHFPCTQGGSYDRHRPPDGAAAVAWVEAQRAKGAQFLVWPRPAFWWLEEYPELRQHLDAGCRRVHADADCKIYQLVEPGKAKAP